MARPAIAILAALSLSACAATMSLPTIDHGDLCRGVGFDGVLRGSPNDPRVAWAEQTGATSGAVFRTELVWPPGYTARFTPKIEVLDESRGVRYVDGDIIGGGCVTGPGISGPLYVIEY